jgi:hypothetical protein
LLINCFYYKIRLNQKNGVYAMVTSVNSTSDSQEIRETRGTPNTVLHTLGCQTTTLIAQKPIIREPLSSDGLSPLSGRTTVPGGAALCAKECLRQIEKSFPQGVSSHPLLSKVKAILEEIEKDPDFFRKGGSNKIDCIVTTEGAGAEHGGKATDPDEMMALSIVGFLLNIGAIDRVRLIGDPKVENSAPSAYRFLIESCGVHPSKVIACPAADIPKNMDKLRPLPGSTTIAFGLAAASGLPELIQPDDKVRYMGDHKTHTNPSRDVKAFEKLLEKSTDIMFNNRKDMLLEKRGFAAGLLLQLGFPVAEVMEAVEINMRNALAYVTTCSFAPAISNRWKPYLEKYLGIKEEIAPSLIALCEVQRARADELSKQLGAKVERPYILALAQYVCQKQDSASIQDNLLPNLTDIEVENRLAYYMNYFHESDTQGKKEYSETLASLSPEAKRVVLASQTGLLKDLASLNFNLPADAPLPQTLEDWKGLADYLIITPYDPATVADGAWELLCRKEPTIMHRLGADPRASVDEGLAVTLTLQMMSQKMAELHSKHPKGKVERIAAAKL